MQGIAKVRSEEHRGYLELPKSSDYTDFDTLEHINYVYITNTYFLISNFLRVLNVVCFLWVNSPAFEVYKLQISRKHATNIQNILTYSMEQSPS
jgi:hypothetical protein